ncbi:hypothetical protein, partial [Burkholderia ambifaria]|uniref:hypothetical protein n=1 Tax=Burkholderia ambifaria TaxID=152480 RepID=UPI001ABB41F7
GAPAFVLGDDAAQCRITRSHDETAPARRVRRRCIAACSREAANGPFRARFNIWEAVAQLDQP